MPPGKKAQEKRVSEYSSFQNRSTLPFSLHSWKVDSCDFLEFLPENPIKVFHVLWVDGNKLDSKVVVTSHFVFHLPNVFGSFALIVHIQHSPVFDVDIVVGQVEIGTADLFSEDPNT